MTTPHRGSYSNLRKLDVLKDALFYATISINQRYGKGSPLRCVSLMQGKILGGRYQIIRDLGGGGFGTTFVAQDRHLPGNPQCVVKQLKPQTTDEPLALQAARRLFNREAEVLYLLGNHPQIPRLFAHFEENQEFYLVQEFIEGNELKQELQLGQQLSEAQVIVLLQEILEILAFVHQQNVIHRDIKPSNLLRRRQDGKLVLIDFGAVKQISNQVINDPGEKSLTIAIGSPGYMPNEQLAGKPRFCSDIYAVGILGIQALTGLHPTELPEDPTTSEIIWRNQVQVSPDLGDILDKMVRYDFRDRYQSAVETLSAINSLPSTPFTPILTIPIAPAQPHIHSLQTQLILPDELRSERGIDYTLLRDLLAAGKWKEADRETRIVMRKASGQEQEGLLNVEDINNFPCIDLGTINQLWEEYSNGRFGFRVQKRIWHSVGGTNNYDPEVGRRFATQVGWRRGGSWLNYSDLTFHLSAPQGHLPWLVLGNRKRRGGIFFRIDVCKL